MKATTILILSAWLATSAFTLGCGSGSSQVPSSAEQTAAAAVSTPDCDQPQGTPTCAVTPLMPAELGKPAPDFTLTDLDGKTVRLGDYAGKTVVLEWFNPECPFVKVAYGRELSLKGSAERHAADGVVWLSINSNAPGRQGADPAANRAGRDAFAIDHPILLDPEGIVGRAYSAKRTPQMYVIAPDGRLVYAGAIDNTRGGDLEDADPQPAKNYVDNALEAIKSGGAVEPPQTEPWGCSVKYATPE